MFSVIHHREVASVAQTRKLIIGLFTSAIVASVLGNIVSTQFVFASLSKVGAPLTFSNRISMTFSDILGFGPMYGIFIFIGFIIAFLAGGAVYKLSKTGRTIIYTAAGLTAMVVMLYMMKNVFFGVQLVAGARSLAGVIAQGFVGALAGFLFARMTALKATS